MELELQRRDCLVPPARSALQERAQPFSKPHSVTSIPENGPTWFKRRGKPKPLPPSHPLWRHRLPAVVLPAGKPEGAVTAIAVRSEVVWEPSRHLQETQAKCIKERAIRNKPVSHLCSQIQSKAPPGRCLFYFESTNPVFATTGDRQ